MRHLPTRADSAAPTRSRRRCSVFTIAALSFSIGAASCFAPALASPASAAETCAPSTSAKVVGPPPALAQLGLSAGDAMPTGAGVLVAIIDSGVDASRPQLSDAFGPGSVSLIADDQPASGLTDVFGHGTAVAGIIAARPSSQSGVVGVAPEAKIISIRAFRGDDDNLRSQGLGPDAARTAAGIRLAADAGAQIIVVAMADDTDEPGTRAATEYATALGSLVVASAGDAVRTEDGAPAPIEALEAPHYPAAYPDALGVTALDIDGLTAVGGMRGAQVDVAAPGQNVLTTATGAGDCVYAGDAPDASFATAYAAGAAALVAEAFPLEGPAGWAYRLKATADRPNPDSHDPLVGWGRLQPLLAIGLRPDASTRGPESPFADNLSTQIDPPTTQVSAAAEAPDNTPVIIGVSAAALSLLATFAVLGRLRRRFTA